MRVPHFSRPVREVGLLAEVSSRGKRSSSCGFGSLTRKAGILTTVPMPCHSDQREESAFLRQARDPSKESARCYATGLA